MTREGRVDLVLVVVEPYDGFDDDIRDGRGRYHIGAYCGKRELDEQGHVRCFPHEDLDVFQPGESSMEWGLLGSVAALSHFAYLCLSCLLI